MNKTILNEKLEWAIIGWAIGDAMWIPVEYMPTQEIKARYWRVMDFLETRSNAHFAKKGFNEEGSGYISDDTLLTLATLDALTEAWIIDFPTICAKQIEYYESFDYGFWRSTTDAFEAIKKWESYLTSWNPLGTWNGIMMKQTPLAFYQVSRWIREDEIANDIITYSKITHDNKLVIVSALVHNRMLVDLILTEWEMNKRKLLSRALEIARKYEEELSDVTPDQENISDKLEELLMCMDENGVLDLSDDEILKKFGWNDGGLGYACYIRVTLPLIYALFFRSPDFKGFIDTINIWWDTDTYAAIIGNMIWAYRGRFYDEKYEGWVREIRNIKNSIDSFSKKFIWA
ncbi:MAG: hypothetical protein ACD_3C00169G0004 [uncultured bacterium (gcode 4)]|uniref:ADP-ribosylglycohydrolase n=1 Tax=uncultured bacterium (gcode 4) TaxID=1234023 RepID=K2GBY4_9BACT|nr:MAG: hypothetical protein ACD_3C00169G0004 [uncultured bacterium (gcode 4)]